MSNENENQLPAVTKQEVKTKSGQTLKIADLNGDIEAAIKNDQFKFILNQEPNPKWLKDHNSATKKQKDARGNIREVPAQYLPIDKHEILLDYIFQEWRIEVKEVQQLFNAIAVTVRVHYKNPMTKEWSFHDGVGANILQLNKDSAASDLGNIKANAVMIGLPAAKSYAIKDACEHLGKLFGRDLNRADQTMYQMTYAEKPKQPDSSDAENARVFLLIDQCRTRENLQTLEKFLKTNEQRIAYDNKFKELKK